MALEKRNPLPAGRYWIDTFGDSIEKFTAWLSTNSKTVETVSSEYDPGEPGPFSDPIRHEWVLFRVTAPTAWLQGIGWPTVASQDVKIKADTVQRPPPEQLPSLTGAFAESAMTLTVVSAIALGAWLLLFRRRPK